MPLPAIPVALGLGLLFFLTRKGSKEQAEENARNLYATAMGTGLKDNAEALELYAQKIEALAVRPDLANELRSRALVVSRDAEARNLYATAMGTGIKTNKAALELYAQKIEALGNHPDYVAALRAAAEKL